MKKNKAQKYAVAAMVQIAAHQSKEPLSAIVINERVSLPLRFLKRLLRELANAGLLESTLGRHGGFKLAQPANQITLHDIVDAVQGGLKNEPVEIAGGHRWLNEERAFDAIDSSIRKELGAIILSSLRAAKAT